MRALALLLGFCSCVAYDETVHVHVRDPALVEVISQTPIEGSNDASVTREGATLVATCPSCDGMQTRTVLDELHQIALTGDLSTLGRHGDVMRLRYDYLALFPCHRSRGNCERTGFSVTLETPRANIVDIYDQKVARTVYGEKIGAKIGTTVGIIASLIGLALIGDGIFDSTTTRDTKLGVGGMFLSVGGLFTVLGLATLTAVDSNSAITP
jgi:hypothetical protein